MSDRSNQGQEGQVLLPLGEASSILVSPKPLSGGKFSHSSMKDPCLDKRDGRRG